MKREKYLQSGKLTEITPSIKILSKSFNSEGLEFAFDAIRWIKENLVENRNVSNKHTNIRSAQKILEDKEIAGCTEYTLIFIALMRAKGIPAKYIEGIWEGWLNSEETYIRGHVIAEILISNKHYFVDTDRGAIRTELYQNLVVYAQGLDTWDVGLLNDDILQIKFSEFRERWQKQHS